MRGEWVPSPVDPVKAGEDFWRRYHEFRRVRQKETRPDEPVRYDADEEAHMKRLSPFQGDDRFEIAGRGEMLGLLHGTYTKPESPEYESNKHLYEADIFVRTTDRRNGVASSFLPVIVELLDRRGCTIVGFWIEEDAGHGFMKWVGAESKLNEIESRLMFSEIDWPTLERWVEEGARRSPGTRLEIIDGPVPEAEREAFSDQLSVMLNTIPMEALDHGEIVVTPDTMRDHYERFDLSHVVSHTVLTREPDGTISGITEVTWAPFRSPLIEQQFTGVLPDARGRGLGKWIKAAMLLHVRDLYPDTRWISTGNAGSNAPMLKINRALGFKPYRTGTAYQITRDRLAERLTRL
jgi:mycothiol synthase